MNPYAAEAATGAATPATSSPCGSACPRPAMLRLRACAAGGVRMRWLRGATAWSIRWREPAFGLDIEQTPAWAQREVSMTIWAGNKINVTPDHLKLLGRANWIWEDAEYGAAAIDPKRPFGNSDVERDINEALGREVDNNEANRICVDLVTVMSLLCWLASTGGSIAIGRWEWRGAWVHLVD